MAWQAYVSDVQWNGPLLSVFVVISDGVSTKFEKGYTVQPNDGFDTVSWLASQARVTVASLTDAKKVSTAVQRGDVVDLSDPPPPKPPVDPDPEKTAFRADFRRFMAIQAYVGAGVLDPDQNKEYVGLLASLRSSFDPRFI